MSESYLFTSESVGEGHPDKGSDQISDAVLDAVLAQDPRSRVAAETLCNTGLVTSRKASTRAAGSISSKAPAPFRTRASRSSCCGTSTCDPKAS